MMSKKSVIAKEDVSNVVVSLTENAVKRAITLLMYTSGLSFDIINRMTLRHLENACGYFNDDNRSVSDLIQRNPIKEQWIPMWDVSEGDIKRIVFSTPQSLFYIFQHLHDRDTLEPDEPLFLNENNKPLADKYMTNWLTPSFRKKINENSQFTGGNLNYSFKELCKSHPPREFFPDQILKLFEGSEDKRVSKFYDKTLGDNSIILDYYKENLLPHLTIDLQLEEPEYKVEASKSEAEVQQPVSNNVVSKSNYDVMEIKSILNKYYMDNIHTSTSVNYDKYYQIMDSALGRALAYNKQGKFNESKSILKAIFKKTQIELIFKNNYEFIGKSWKEYMDNDYQEVLDKLYVLGINRIIFIDDERLKEVIDSLIGHYIWRGWPEDTIDDDIIESAIMYYIGYEYQMPDPQD